MASTSDSWAGLLRQPQQHMAQLYRTPEFLAEAVGVFLAEGAQRGETGIVFATPEHNAAILRSVQQQGAVPDELFASGRLVLCDAAGTLATFMRDGKIDRALVVHEIGGLLKRIGATGAGMRAYGEMVMLLWRDGNAAAAIELEDVWNELVAEHSLSLLCGYHAAEVDHHSAEFAEVCRAHAQVLPAEQVADEDLRGALELRDQFIAVAAHELRTPITSLQLQLEMARGRLATSATIEPEQLQRLLDVSLRQVGRLATLVESMLAVSPAHPGNLAVVKQPTDLSEIVTHVYERLRDQLHHVGCTVTLDLGADLRGCWDVVRLEQVMENLLANVIKYAPTTPVTITTRRSAAGFQLIVSDHGPGVAAERQHTIFDRFQRVSTQRAVGGLGLGLYIARQIVEAHGGRIRVDTTHGGGATFIIDLP